MLTFTDISCEGRQMANYKYSFFLSFPSTITVIANIKNLFSFRDIQWKKHYCQHLFSITSNKDTDLSKMEEGVVVAESDTDLVLIQVRIPDLKAEKCLQFCREERVWDVKQQILAAMPKVRS